MAWVAQDHASFRLPVAASQIDTPSGVGQSVSSHLGAGARLGRSRLGGDFHCSGGITKNRTKLTQESHAGGGALHQYAAAIQRVGLATNQVEFRQTVERAGDCRLRNTELGGEA